MKLTEEEAGTFHTNVAKLLFLAKQVRPDILTAVSFLCTRVSQPDKDDERKLNRVIKYLRGTKGIPLTLEVGSEHGIKWWVNARDWTQLIEIAINCNYLIAIIIFIGTI